jgi:hypothetical protein
VTEVELERVDRTCIICLEEMTGCDHNIKQKKEEVVVVEKPKEQ